MSRSRKDGRRHGGHQAKRWKEIWSRRCKKVNMWSFGSFAKRVTHRFERRIARQEIVEELATNTHKRAA